MSGLLALPSPETREHPVGGIVQCPCRLQTELWEQVDQGQDAATLLEQIVERKSGPESEAAADVLRAAKAWTFGADIQSPSVYEERDFLSGELWKEFREGGSAYEPDHRAEEKKLEAKVPKNHREEYLRRFRLAVQAAPLREDRFAFHHQATAILRAAVLELGRRATTRNRRKHGETVCFIHPCCSHHRACSVPKPKA